MAAQRKGNAKPRRNSNTESSLTIPVQSVNMDACPLCFGQSVELFLSKRQPWGMREFLICNTCSCIFVPAEHWVSEEVEKHEYDQHDNNTFADEGYRRFLSRTAEQVPNCGRGLDFGCGEGSVLAQMLVNSEREILCYDKFYSSQNFENVRVVRNLDELQEGSLDFVTATEVFEHLHEPRREITRLLRLLKPGGSLIVQTKRHVRDLSRFRDWHYIRDPTHVFFYHQETFEWIRDILAGGGEISMPHKDVAVLTMPQNQV